jgi:transcriptional regulator with XRE-family HTH domain
MFHMMHTQTVITREVRRFMAAQHMTQTALAERLGISQGRVSDRLRGTTNWSLDDMDRLWDLGVPIALPDLAGWGGDEA